MREYPKASPWSYVIAVALVLLLGFIFEWLQKPMNDTMAKQEKLLKELNPNANNAPVQVGIEGK